MVGRSHEDKDFGSSSRPGCRKTVEGFPKMSSRASGQFREIHHWRGLRKTDYKPTCRYKSGSHERLGGLALVDKSCALAIHIRSEALRGSPWPPLPPRMRRLRPQRAPTPESGRPANLRPHRRGCLHPARRAGSRFRQEAKEKWCCPATIPCRQPDKGLWFLHCRGRATPGRQIGLVALCALSTPP